MSAQLALNIPQKKKQSPYHGEVGCKGIRTLFLMEIAGLHCNKCKRHFFSHLECLVLSSFRKCPFMMKSCVGSWLPRSVPGRTVRTGPLEVKYLKQAQACQGLAATIGYILLLHPGACADGGLRKYFISFITGDQNKTDCRIWLPSPVCFLFYSF